MSFISRKAELRQETRLLPQLLQSIEILQMDSQELLEHLGPDDARELLRIEKKIVQFYCK